MMGPLKHLGVADLENSTTLAHHLGLCSGSMMECLMVLLKYLDVDLENSTKLAHHLVSCLGSMMGRVMGLLKHLGVDLEKSMTTVYHLGLYLGSMTVALMDLLSYLFPLHSVANCILTKRSSKDQFLYRISQPRNIRAHHML